MREKINLKVEKKEPKRIVDEEVGYRLIGGVPEKAEKFTKLEEEVDYELLRVNKKVKSDKSIGDFLLFVNPTGGTEEAVVKAPHWRTVTIPWAKTEVQTEVSRGDDIVEVGVPFYDVNVKGVGYLKPSVAGENKLDDYDVWISKIDHEQHDYGYKTYGIMSKDEFDTKSGDNLVIDTNFYLKEGLRTEVFWGAAKLKRVVFRGRMTTIDELRKENIILKRREYIPVMGVRLLKTNDRIQEAAESDERRPAIFKKAFEVFNRETKDMGLDFPELDIGNREHQRIFFKEFFLRMGSNMAGLLNIGRMHSVLHSANVTMAAEIADVGTMGRWQAAKEQEEYSKVFGGLRRGHIKDMRDIVYGLKILLSAGKKMWLDSGRPETLVDEFMSGFDSKLKRDVVAKEQKTDPDDARRWMEKIVRAVIVEGINLPSLRRNEVTDWKI